MLCDYKELVKLQKIIYITTVNILCFVVQIVGQIVGKKMIVKMMILIFEVQISIQIRDKLTVALMEIK